MSSTDITKNAEEASIDKEPTSFSNSNFPNESALIEPSTSKGIKAYLAVNISIKPTESIHTIQEDNPLSSLDDLAQTLMQEKEAFEENESFVTVSGCLQETSTSTQPIVIFSTNAQTDDRIIQNTRQNQLYNSPPPPYDYDRYQNRGQLRQTPIYQDRHLGNTQEVYVVQDVSRAPPYRRNYDVPENLVNVFLDEKIRNRFVQRVYMILFLQLLVTFSFIFLCLFQKEVHNFVKHDLILPITSGVVYFVTLIALFCCQQTRRIFPLNFVLLSVLTLAMAYMTAFISCWYNTHIVLFTFGVTAGICFLITFVASLNCIDVTNFGMALLIATAIVMIYGIIAFIITLLTGSSIVYLIYSCLITLLFCMYLMYDTQQILGGGRISLSPEEYILGALTLYVDIMLIFQNLLYILNYMFGASR